jgi:hypothetical protein
MGGEEKRKARGMLKRAQTQSTFKNKKHKQVV